MVRFLKSTKFTPNVQAGLLTLGSSYLPRLPIQFKLDSDILRPLQNVQFSKVSFAVFVPDYSGGPVPDFHRVPYYAST
jgi:hypothetical protein